MKVLLVGAGRFAWNYIRYLQAKKHPDIEWIGAVEAYKTEGRAAIEEMGLPIYESLEAFYEGGNTADLVILATPAFLHASQAIYAVKHGSNVLSEKPAAPTGTEVLEMMKAEKETGKFIGIGFQWSYSPEIIDLKQDILSGRYGKAVSFKTKIDWPRDFKYYSQGYSGKVKLGDYLVIDSIASNATAHYIHNIFFLLGSAIDKSAYPASVEVETLRANNIENFDTIALRMKMEDGAEIYYNATHTGSERMGPVMVYEFEKGRVVFNPETKGQLVGVFNNGDVKIYGAPYGADNVSKVGHCIDAIKAGTTPVCTAETAYPHAKLIEEIYKNAPIYQFPEEMIERYDDHVAVKGIEAKIDESYEKCALFSEIGYDFVKPSKF